MPDKNYGEIVHAAYVEWKTEEAKLWNKEYLEFPGEHRLHSYLMRAVRECLLIEACKDEAVKHRVERAAWEERERIAKAFLSSRKIKKDFCDHIAEFLRSSAVGGVQ
jgi:hypothetical protein